MLGRHLPGRHGVITQKSRLAHKDVISAVCIPSGSGVITDVKQLFALIVKRHKIKLGKNVFKPHQGIQKRGFFAGVFLYSLAYRNKANGKISVVNGRYKRLSYNLKGLQIIPVIKVSVPFEELFNRTRGVADILRKRGAVNISEISRCESRNEKQPDIRRRCPHRNSLRWRKLIIIRRKIVCLLADIIRKETPFPFTELL